MKKILMMLMLILCSINLYAWDLYDYIPVRLGMKETTALKLLKKSYPNIEQKQLKGKTVYSAAPIKINDAIWIAKPNKDSNQLGYGLDVFVIDGQVEAIQLIMMDLKPSETFTIDSWNYIIKKLDKKYKYVDSTHEDDYFVQINKIDKFHNSYIKKFINKNMILIYYGLTID